MNYTASPVTLCRVVSGRASGADLLTREVAF